MVNYISIYNKDLTSKKFENCLANIKHSIEQFAKDNNVYKKYLTDEKLINILSELRGLYDKEYKDVTLRDLGFVGSDYRYLYLLDIEIAGGTKRMYDTFDLLERLMAATDEFAVATHTDDEYQASNIKSSIKDLCKKL